MLPEVHPETSKAYRLGGMTLFFVAAIILGALAFEYIGGFKPCPLCLMQRYAYYASLPVLFVAMALISERPIVSALLFFLVALAFLANGGLGVYHAGAEWGFWPGPDTCAGASELPKSAADLLKQAETEVVVRCDQPAIVIAGLSLAGWNVLASLVAFVGALKAAFFVAAARR